MSELREQMARAMRAQGKVDPDEVFGQVDEPDLKPIYTDAEGRPFDPQPVRETLPLKDEEHGYGYEP